MDSSHMLLRESPIATLAIENQGLVSGLSKYEEIINQYIPMIFMLRPNSLEPSSCSR